MNAANLEKKPRKNSPGEPNGQEAIAKSAMLFLILVALTWLFTRLGMQIFTG
jgi:hypothetical protein